MLNMLVILSFALLLWNIAIAPGVNKMENYWNEKKSDLPMYLEIVSLFFTHLNLCIQQVMAYTVDGYHSGFAWVAFAAAFCHLLGVVSSYIVNKGGMQCYSPGIQWLSSFTALVLLAFSGLSITFECDIRLQAFSFSQLLRTMFEIDRLMPQYYLLLDGKILPLSLISTGDAMNKLKVSDEDSDLVKLDPSDWFKVREDRVHLVKFEPNVFQEVNLSVYSIQQNIIKFTVREDQAHLLKLVKES